MWEMINMKESTCLLLLREKDQTFCMEGKSRFSVFLAFFSRTQTCWTCKTCTEIKVQQGRRNVEELKGKKKKWKESRKQRPEKKNNRCRLWRKEDHSSISLLSISPSLSSNSQIFLCNTTPRTYKDTLCKDRHFQCLPTHCPLYTHLHTQEQTGACSVHTLVLMGKAWLSERRQ